MTANPVLEALLEKARKATPGPHVALTAPDMPTDCCEFGVVAVNLSRETCRVWNRDDAVFYAAFDPSTAIALIELLMEAERVLEPFDRVGQERASPHCRAVWRFERETISDDDFRAARSLLLRIQGDKP